MIYQRRTKCMMCVFDEVCDHRLKKCQFLRVQRKKR